MNVLEKFNRDFVDQYYLKDAMFTNIVDYLSISDNPYLMIEKLIKERNNMVKKMDELLKESKHSIVLEIPNIEEMDLSDKVGLFRNLISSKS